MVSKQKISHFRSGACYFVEILMIFPNIFDYRPNITIAQVHSVIFLYISDNIPSKYVPWGFTVNLSGPQEQFLRSESQRGFLAIHRCVLVEMRVRGDLVESERESPRRKSLVILARPCIVSIEDP